MVNQHADKIVIAQSRAQTCFSIESRDPRSDDRRRIVEVAQGSVTIRRAVAGVAMTIRVSWDAYRGVALRIRALEGDRFRYEVRLVHRDPDLSVVLGEGDESDQQRPCELCQSGFTGNCPPTSTAASRKPFIAARYCQPEEHR